MRLMFPISKTLRFTGDRWLTKTRDGLDYELSYSIVDTDLVGKPEEESQTRHGTIRVGISGTLSSCWDIDQEELRKVLFEYGQRRIVDKVLESTLGGREELELTTANTPTKCPFDPARIKVLFDSAMEFPLQPEPNIATGHFPETAADIIDLRDNINALFGERFKGRLLDLPQERFLLELFLTCTRREDLAFRIAALGALALSIRSSDLCKILGGQENSKPLNLLGAFLREKFGETEASEIMEPLKRLNHLRRMYPVHSDRADGVMKAFEYFGIVYPVRDFSVAWKTLVESYRATLRRLLHLLRGNRIL
jgi:hypothetical protein